MYIINLVFHEHCASGPSLLSPPSYIVVSIVTSMWWLFQSDIIPSHKSHHYMEVYQVLYNRYQNLTKKHFESKINAFEHKKHFPFWLNFPLLVMLANGLLLVPFVPKCCNQILHKLLLLLTPYCHGFSSIRFLQWLVYRISLVLHVRVSLCSANSLLHLAFYLAGL